MILLNNSSYLFISARYSKYGIIIRMIWNIVKSKDVSRLTDVIDRIFVIPKAKLADPIMFLSIWIEILSYYIAFSGPISPVDWDKAPESLNIPLNLILLYCELVDKLKT